MVISNQNHSQSIEEGQSDEYYMESKNTNKLLNTDYINEKNMVQYRSSDLFVDKEEEESEDFDLDFKKRKIHNRSVDDINDPDLIDIINNKKNSIERKPALLEGRHTNDARGNEITMKRSGLNKFAKRYSQKLTLVTNKQKHSDKRPDSLFKTDTKKSKKRTKISSSRKISSNIAESKYHSLKNDDYLRAINRRSAETDDKGLSIKPVITDWTARKPNTDISSTAIAKNKSFAFRNTKKKGTGIKKKADDKFIKWVYSVKGGKKSKT